jgi:hypothetical protein
MSADGFGAEIEAIVDEAPPLTQGQRSRLRRALTGTAPPDPRDDAAPGGHQGQGIDQDNLDDRTVAP